MRFQRRKSFAIFAALAAFASVASAQVIGKTMTVAGLPACNSDKNFGLVTDATNATTLGAGGGSARVWVKCVSGTWTIQEVAAVADLSAYLPVSGTTAAPIVIQNSGAGNDVSAIALDDLFLTPGDALVAVAGGNTTITSTAGTVAISSSAGSVTIGAVGATQDVTVSATDDVILSPTDALTLSGTTSTLNAGGGAVEVSVAADSVAIIGAFKLTKSSAPPVACAAGTEGTVYLDSDIHKLCVCNATAYVLVNDDSTTTGCS